MKKKLTDKAMWLKHSAGDNIPEIFHIDSTSGVPLEPRSKIPESTSVRKIHLHRPREVFHFPTQPRYEPVCRSVDLT